MPYSAASLIGGAGPRLPVGRSNRSVGSWSGENFGRWEHVGIFGVHVAQADGVTGLAAVEAALLCQGHPIVEAEGVDHGGAHAA